MTKRSYKQDCFLARSSDLLTERWTLLIFRELLIQPCRFKQLNTWLAGMGTNLLAQRLKELEAAGLIEKQLPEEKRSAYQLTTTGHEVEPVLLSLIRWGFSNLSPSDDDEYQHHPHWDLLALKALFNGERCNSSMKIQFESPALTAWVNISPEGLRYQFGTIQDADLRIPMTISEFKQSAAAGDYSQQPQMEEFIDCFSA